MQIWALDVNYEQQVSVQESSGEGHQLPALYKGRAAKFQLIIHLNEGLVFGFLHKQQFKKQ